MADHPAPQQASQQYYPPAQPISQQHAQCPPQYSPAVKANVLALQQHQSPNQSSETPFPQAPAQASAQAVQLPPPVRPQNANMLASPQGQSPAPTPANTQQNGSGTPQSANQGFKSPVMRTLPNDQRHENEVAELKNLMAKSRPEAVRRAVRDMFETTLVGSDYHSSFVCHSIFHKAPPHVFGGAVKDLGSKLIKSSINEVATHIDARELDVVAAQLLPKASTAFLDQALAIRLESIPGRQLVNLLARAERLGYNVEDIVMEQNSASGPERVIPAMKNISAGIVASHSPASPSPSGTTSTTSSAVPPETISRLGIQFCKTCGRPCSGKQALDVHLRNANCLNANISVAQLNKTLCVHCGQSFTGTGGLNYHTRSKVCGDYAFPVQHAVDTLLKAAPPPQERRDAPPPTALPKKGRPPNSRLSSPGVAPYDSDPAYANLTAEQRQKFAEEMRQVEEKYEFQMDVAMKIENVDERTDELSRLKNRYNNKQSMTRKKYGIRLRERRTRAKIENERSGLLGQVDSANKRARIDGSMPGVIPSKRVLMSDMEGGLSASAGTAELRDPTVNSGMPQPQFQNHTAQAFRPIQPGSGQPQVTPARTSAFGTVGDPMDIEDTSTDEDAD